MFNFFLSCILICNLTSCKMFLVRQATFDVNVFGTITLTRLLAPSMMDRGMGHFVVVCLYNSAPINWKLVNIVSSGCYCT